jgi:hypothetical protein
MSIVYESEPAVPERFRSNPKKPGWFKRWFFRMSQEAWDHRHEQSKQANHLGPIFPSAVGRNILNTRNSIDMSLVRADGGWIVQFQSYDDRTDRTNVNHYVIPDNEDFGQRLSEIITLQCMR